MSDLSVAKNTIISRVNAVATQAAATKEKADAGVLATKALLDHVKVHVQGELDKVPGISADVKTKIDGLLSWTHDEVKALGITK